MGAKKYNLALKFLLEGIKTYPDDLEFNFRYIATHIHTIRPSSILSFRLGDLFFETKKFGEAVQYYSTALNLALSERRPKKYIDTLKVGPPLLPSSFFFGQPTNYPFLGMDRKGGMGTRGEGHSNTNIYST